MNVPRMRRTTVASSDMRAHDASDVWRSPVLPDHREVLFEFTGTTDDVPVDAAAALARVLRWWWGHADQHTGRAPSAQIALTGTDLSVRVSDPECSPVCVYGIREPEPMKIRPPSELLAGRLSLRRPDGGGLRLEWGFDPSTRRLRAGRRWLKRPPKA